MNKTEAQYLFKYISSGMLNTLLGFLVIFAAMWLGASPLLSNVSGYLVGFVLGFVFSKRFVFRSQGHFVKESLRYLLAFTLSFLCNVLALQLYLLQYPSQYILGQVCSGAIYTILMYLLMRFYVFRPNEVSNARLQA